MFVLHQFKKENSKKYSEKLNTHPVNLCLSSCPWGGNSELLNQGQTVSQNSFFPKVIIPPNAEQMPFDCCFRKQWEGNV